MKWNQRAVRAQGPTVAAVGEAHDPIGEVVTNLEVVTHQIISTHQVTKRQKSEPILEEISEVLKDQVRFHCLCSFASFQKKLLTLIESKLFLSKLSLDDNSSRLFLTKFLPNDFLRLRLIISCAVGLGPTGSRFAGLTF